MYPFHSAFTCSSFHSIPCSSIPCSAIHSTLPIPTAASFLQGILGAYQYAISQVQLYGPTNFSSFLDRVITMASQPTTQQDQSYYILLVITVSQGILRIYA